MNRVEPRLAIFAVVSGGIILWAILPRPERFEPPGPMLSVEKHPAVFRELERICRSVGQPVPAQVFLMPEVNAWVAQRGGLLGFGSRRVMAIGLPLLQLVTVSQFEAIVLHELGHYWGGDTKLGPWIYRTRATIGRTIESLSQRPVLQKVFLAYGDFFLRVTHAISRRQELAADALSARIVGGTTASSALRMIEAGVFLHSTYWWSDVVPCLEAGYIPPITAGFSAFLRLRPITEPLAVTLTAPPDGPEKADPFDTHPPLHERLAAIRQVPDPPSAADARGAISLLASAEQAEEELLDFLQRGAQNLQRLPWSEVPARVYLPGWISSVEGNGAVLLGVTFDDLPKLAADRTRIDAMGRALLVDPLTTEEDRFRIVAYLADAAMAGVLTRLGFEAAAGPGEPVRLTRDAIVVEPFGTFAALAAEQLSAEEWSKRCRELGLDGVQLVSRDPPAPPARNPTAPPRI